MIKVREVKVSVLDKNEEKIKESLARKLKIDKDSIINIYIKKESIDARDKNDVLYVYEIDAELKNEDSVLKKNKNVEKTFFKKYDFYSIGDKVLNKRPIIVGMGPSGLFAAYMLSLNGFKPIVIDRGEPVLDRVKSVEEFWNSGKLNINSNISFGEGGAGTFSDGKLNTLTGDKECRIQKVFEIFVEHGASKEILYASKPHIGTDILRNVIVSMRNEMINKGATFKYNSCVTDIVINDNKISKVIINNDEEIETDVLVLGIGNGARDTYQMLYNKNISMEAKPFAVGVRIMHDRVKIDESQYGKFARYCPSASYKLTYNTSDKKGVYTFCMCPGGYVINASSEEKRLCINGMSNYKRDSKTSNSAVVVTVDEKDYGNGLFNGLNFQRMIEEKAFNIGKGKIPVQFYKDFKDNTINKSIDDINVEFKGDISYANLNDIFPDKLSSSIKEGIDNFGKKINGFDDDNALLAGVESRTSSPIRIIRDDNMESNIRGIYPIGEGAGYAGGITTSSVDGIKVSEKIMHIYKGLGDN